MLCTNEHGTGTHSDRARLHISALPRISPEVGRRPRRTDEIMIIPPLETSINRVRSKPCRKSLRPAVNYCSTACDLSPSSKLQGCGVNYQPARREGEQSQKRFDTRLMQEGEYRGERKKSAWQKNLAFSLFDRQADRNATPRYFPCHKKDVRHAA